VNATDHNRDLSPGDIEYRIINSVSLLENSIWPLHLQADRTFVEFNATYFQCLG